MTPEQATALQVKITEQENEIAALRQQEANCIEQVRVFANKRREVHAVWVSLDNALEPLRQQLAAHVQEMHRQNAERARIESERKMAEEKAAAEAAAAAKAQEQSENQKLKAELEAVKAQLAAKG